MPSLNCTFRSRINQYGFWKAFTITDKNQIEADWIQSFWKMCSRDSGKPFAAAILTLTKAPQVTVLLTKMTGNAKQNILRKERKATHSKLRFICLNVGDWHVRTSCLRIMVREDGATIIQCYSVIAVTNSLLGPSFFFLAQCHTFLQENQLSVLYDSSSLPIVPARSSCQSEVLSKSILKASLSCASM